MVNLTLIITAITGLILFLYGMENFSREVQRASVGTLRKIISKLTKNRFYSTATGAVVTSLIQSSTAITVITVGLVDAGIITFAQSLGIILGANIGSTVTAQLIAFKFTSLAPVFLIGGFIISLFGKRYRIPGKILFYFGLVFFSLGLIATSLAPIKDNPFVVSYASQMSNVFLALFFGFLFTVIVHSSSVTAGIVILLAGDGIITLNQGIPLLLGANIGTTVIALIASMKLNVHAKRAAMAHFVFNFLGVLMFLPIINPFANFVMSLGGNASHQVANAHTIFNVVTVLIFLIVFTPFRKLIEKIVPGKEKEILLKPKYLSDKLPDNNDFVFDLIEKEIKYSMEITIKMFKKAYETLKTSSEKDIEEVNKLELLNDIIDNSIEKALLDVNKRKLSRRESEKSVLLIRISNALEQLGDLADDLGILKLKMEEGGIKIPPDSKIGIDKIYLEFIKFISEMKTQFPKAVSMKKIKVIKEKALKGIDYEYKNHVARELKRKSNSGSVFVESASIIESSFDKLNEIAELTAEYNKI